MPVTKSATKSAAKTVKKPAAKPAVKKTAAKAAVKKAPAKKSAAKKTTVVASKVAKPTVKKAAPKKVATTAKALAKKVPVKKPAVSAAKKAAPKKPVAKKATNPIDTLVKQLEKALDMNKAEEIVAINLVGRSSLADYMIVASGRSARQVAALANYVQQELAKQGYKKMRVEGLPQGDWVIVDSGDVVIHLFRPEVRDFYQLEKLWAEDEIEPTTRISLR